MKMTALTVKFVASAVVAMSLFGSGAATAGDLGSQIRQQGSGPWFNGHNDKGSWLETAQVHRLQNPRSQPAVEKITRNPVPGTAPRNLHKTTHVGPSPGEHSKPWPGSGRDLPASTVGELSYKYKDQDGHEHNAGCTATVVTAANRSTIWTAGHCVHTGPLPGANIPNQWYYGFTFRPGHSGNVGSPGSVDPFGKWTAASVSVPNGWRYVGLKTYDFAAIALQRNASGNRIQDLTGSQGIRFFASAGQNVHFFGYPGALQPQLRYCTGRTFGSPLFPFEPAPKFLRCDMGEGSSGGPWISDLRLSRGWGYIIGNESGLQSAVDNANESPALNQAAVNVYNAEQGA